MYPPLSTNCDIYSFHKHVSGRIWRAPYWWEQMKHHSSIKSNWKASVNFLLQISRNKTKSTKNKSFLKKHCKCNFFKKAKAYLSLRARATERNFTHNGKSIYLLKSKSTFIFKSKSKSMCIAHFNPQNQVYI